MEYRNYKPENYISQNILNILLTNLINIKFAYGLPFSY